MRFLLTIAPLFLLACSSSTSATSSHDAGHTGSPDVALILPPRDAGHDAPKPHDAKPDAPPLDCKPYDGAALDGGTLTIPVVATAHLVQATPFVDAMATLPAGCWSSVKVQLTVSSNCTGAPPSDQNWPTNCDPYDRLAQVTLGDTIAKADGGVTPLFVLDAVTSFGGTETWEQDVTDYFSLLEGAHTYHLEVDTYADSTGMATGTASSHDASLSIVLTAGVPPHDVVAAVPLLRQDITTPPVVADAATDGGPVIGALTAKITAPAGATSGRLDFFTSGHGGNGPESECDEFCQKVNDVSVDGKSLYAMAPESNCTDNCAHVDAGQTFSCGGESFGYYCQQNPESCPSSAVAPRSNWCPSQIIAPIPLVLPASALSGEHTFEVQVVAVDGTWPVGLSAVFFK